jgi:SAM-dependent methyltransferase
VVLFGAPYLPTLKKRAEDAFDLLDLKPGQILLELGSGDGRILRMAAKKGIKGIGYELNPLLVWYSQARNWRYRKLISFKCRNFWQVKLPECDGIYTFLLDKYMLKLDKKIIQEKHKSVKLVSFAFKIPDKKIIKQKNALFLYNY